ncbi:glutamate racemase [Weissella beninensis]|uniref:Glutamate racemase n=1 Tax=Periweissella beninensis TaxID=504936 RepID=A0ABT0VFB3_9LACO|nr:glutamate racemase [Periweissella beninensis]MBM7543529.1 glutamate racemase [Periweissella beninensis]MCM2436511.1 glutamate racemase [Periweissella beninensis]
MVNQAIGFIDSGIGGITVVREALRQLPNETVYYVGDTARMPYGPRPVDEVIEYTWQMVKFLLTKNIKMLVIACNTATAAALPSLQKKLAIPVIGVIAPGVRGALKATVNKHIGIIATEGTVKSNAYVNRLKAKNPNIVTSQLACPEFVKIVEANQYATVTTQEVVTKKLAFFNDKNIDTLVLGCTHFPLLADVIKNAMGSQVSLVNSGAVAVENVSAMLDELQLNNSGKKSLPDEYFTTGDANSFKQMAGHWLNNQNLDVSHLEITKKGLVL